MRRGAIAVTDNREIQSIIEKVRIVHIGMIDNGLPYSADQAELRFNRR